MKIDRPTKKEIKYFYLKNKNHYRLLSEYYSVHDKKYYEEVFLYTENNFSVENRLRKFKFSITIMTLFAVFLLFFLYLLPVDIETNYSIVNKKAYSIGFTIIDKSDFEKALKKFERGDYSGAKGYFARVDETDENFMVAQKMIRICDEKIDNEVLSDSDDKTIDYLFY